MRIFDFIEVVSLDLSFNYRRRSSFFYKEKHDKRVYYIGANLRFPRRIAEVEKCAFIAFSRT